MTRTTRATSPDAKAASEEQMVEELAQTIAHLDHVLPGQAPILNFVHHNTLHGYQHLPFDEALEAARAKTGVFGYLRESEFRSLYASGRINSSDIEWAFKARSGLEEDRVLVSVGDRAIRRSELLHVALLHGMDAVGPSELRWLLEVHDATTQFDSDVPEAARRMILEEAEREAVAYGKPGPEARAAAVRDLWLACPGACGLVANDSNPAHWHAVPEPEPADSRNLVGERVSSHGEGPALEAETLWAHVGTSMTLGGWVRTLTGQDPLEYVRPMLARVAAAHLDEGLAAWNLPRRVQGLFAAWLELARVDPAPWFLELGDWQERLERLTGDPRRAIVVLLEQLGVPADRHHDYLERVALELPGWSGLVNWRHQRPGYKANREAPTHLEDFLAVRLFLDRVWLEHLCRKTWNIAGTWDSLRAYAEANAAEIFVRRRLFEGQLPEDLAERARTLERQLSVGRATEQWEDLAAAIAAGVNGAGRSWQLFRLAQHLGLSGGAIRQLSRRDVNLLLDEVDHFTEARRCRVWQLAYEQHYRDSLINALAANHGRGRWLTRAHRPAAQIVFCIDEREESIRRHLEELSPEVETLGAAGFFGVVMNWRGLDDHEVTPLCPVVATPVHEIREVAHASMTSQFSLHERGRERWHQLTTWYQQARRNLLTAAAGMMMGGPVMASASAAMVVRPTQYWRALDWVYSRVVPAVPTQVDTEAREPITEATPTNNRRGFTDTEQADRVAGLLRNIGLVQGFAPFVVLMAHGSTSQNNPHEHAHDCGACSGRHGGPNARTFAAMANRPAVRALLKTKGIDVPDDTWFIGAQHNTCDEVLSFFDVDVLPESLISGFERLREELEVAAQWSAHERCRRFAAAPKDASLEKSRSHIAERAYDFSQVRPEWGHATNASALVGRRGMSQGLFLDRRSFLISYDPTIDPDGTILEGVLLAVGPVGAGINLEYYFSTVDRERFGCGTKVPHNVTGLFAVMEGGSSDLRTGLPKQMTEVHEPVRLQIVVEASTAVLGAIYQRQAGLRELIGNEWVHVIAKDPDSGTFSVFSPSEGFVPWREAPRPLPRFARSSDYYRGQTTPLAPALIG